MTIHNLGSKTEVLNLLPNDVLASTAVGSAVDIQTFEGSAAIMLLAEAGGSGITYAIKITECDTSGGTYTDVDQGGRGAFTTTSANTALVEKIYLNLSELKQYLKVSSTVSGGTGAGAVAVVGLGSKKYS